MGLGQSLSKNSDGGQRCCLRSTLGARCPHSHLKPFVDKYLAQLHLSSDLTPGGRPLNLSEVKLLHLEVRRPTSQREQDASTYTVLKAPGPVISAYSTFNR